MATVDEILMTMADTGEETVVATDEVLVIDPNTRQINLPGSELIFGVESDTHSERKYFQAPRMVGNGLDLASCFIRVNFRNGNGKMDSYLVNDVVATDDTVTFSWELSRKVTEYKGTVLFVVCACRPGATAVEWNTTQATGIVLAGLEPDAIDYEAETADVVAQLRTMVEAQTVAVENVGAVQVTAVKNEGATQVSAVEKAATDAESAAVAQIEAKGASTLATIPEDYTALQNAVRGAANAIRGKVSGEVIRVDDVSPMEHYPVVKVSNLNMCEITGEFVSTVGVGGYYTPKRLTYAAPHIENGKTYVFTAESDDDLQNTVLSVVVYGLRASGATTLDSRSSPGVLRCVVTPSDFVRIDTVELRFNRIPSASATEERTITYRNVYFGLVEHEGKGYSYADPTTVTVTRCGKNILPYPFTDTTVTRKGVTFTDNGDGTLTLNGTAEATTAFVLFNGEMPVSGKYTFSGMSGGGGSTYYIQPVCSDKAHTGYTDGNKTYEWSNITLNRLQITVVAGAVFSNLKIALMVEVGDTTSAYEPYVGETQIPSSDGTVSGLTALSPTMTLMTDTPGANIECEYSRDTNKVIAEILEKITALLGEA